MIENNAFVMAQIINFLSQFFYLQLQRINMLFQVIVLKKSFDTHTCLVARKGTFHMSISSITNFM